jgi:hypothetical protein
MRGHAALPGGLPWIQYLVDAETIAILVNSWKWETIERDRTIDEGVSHVCRLNNTTKQTGLNIIERVENSRAGMSTGYI